MASTYTPSLRFDLQAPGDNTMTWGDVANTDFTLIDQAIAGYVSIAMSDANYTLSTANGATDEARRIMLAFTGTLTADRNIIIPAVSKVYLVANKTTGGFNLNVKTSGGVAVTVPVGGRLAIFCDGTDCYANTISSIPTINGGPLNSFRNQIINGDFRIWQRGTVQTASGYGSDDRWNNQHLGSTKTASRQTFTVGQSDVPGNPVFFSRTVVTSVAGAGNFVNKVQPIEGVETLSAGKATVTFYAKADASKNIAIELTQNFGTGGSPSTNITGLGSRLCACTTSWQKFTFTVDIPSISGKTLGSTGNDFVGIVFWFDAGSSYNSRTANLGQQSGTFDIAHVSFVEGDATQETDPFSPRHVTEELALCQRYYQSFTMYIGGYGLGGSGIQTFSTLIYTMRVTPSGSMTGDFSSVNVSSRQIVFLTQFSIGFQAIVAGTGHCSIGTTAILSAEL